MCIRDRYRTMEMKDIARILRLAVWRSHAVAVVATVVSMLAAIAPAAHAKDISPMEAVRIARRVVTPVSYTHLDVYKRQPPLLACISITCFLSAISISC